MLFYQCNYGSLSSMISYLILQGTSYDVVRRHFPYSIRKYRHVSAKDTTVNLWMRYILKNWQKFFQYAKIFLVMTGVSGSFAVILVGIMENS
jgi:hypothetical protein